MLLTQCATVKSVAPLQIFTASSILTFCGEGSDELELGHYLQINTLQLWSLLTSRTSRQLTGMAPVA